MKSIYTKTMRYKYNIYNLYVTKEFPSVSSVTGGGDVINHSDANIQPATIKPTEKTWGRALRGREWGLSAWGGVWGRRRRRR